MRFAPYALPSKPWFDRQMLSLFTSDSEPHLLDFFNRHAAKVLLYAPPEFVADLHEARRASPAAPAITFPVRAIHAQDADAMSDRVPGTGGKVVIVADPAGEEERLAALRAAYPGRRFAGLAGQVLPALVARAGHTLFSDTPLPPKPTRAVILCASPRSGSSLVADVLSDMGCGDVREHLRRGILDALSGKYRFDRAAALGHFLRLAQVNGTFGTKLITHFVEDYIRDIGDLASIRSAFAELDTVWLTLDRTDKLRQAVSGEIASRRGVWHNTGATDEAALRQIAEPAPLHFTSLLGRHLFYGQQSAILAFLNAHGRISLRLTYETDVADGDIPALARKLAAALLLEVQDWTFKRAGARKRLADAASEDLVNRYTVALEHAFEGSRAP